MSLTRIEHRELLRALRLEETIPYELLDRAERHIATCPKCRLVLQRNSQLKKRLKPMLSTSHPVAEELLAYLTADDAAQGDVVAAEWFQSVSAHVKTCTFCQSRVKHLQNEIKQVENLMQNASEELSFERDYQAPVSVAQTQTAKRKIHLRPMPRPMLPVAGACVAFLILFVASLSTQPKTYSFANLNADRLDVLPITRGDSNAENGLLLAEGFINAGEYEEARAQMLAVDESKLSAEQALRLRLCDLMLTLKAAHRSYLSFFPHFEKAEVRTSLARMEEVLIRYLAPPAGNEKRWGLAHYYSAKAYLMLDDENNAIKHLQNAQLTAHQRQPEAEKLLRALTAK